jgi:monoterpene epsilon-lactone hydrolase
MTQGFVEPDGTVHVPAFDVPFSGAMSPEARKVFLRRAARPVPRPGKAEPGLSEEEAWLAAMQQYRAGMETLHRRLSELMREQYEVEITPDEIGGVPVDVVMPRAGVSERNRDRVLVNLHGGAFVGGGEYCGIVESIPLAAIGRIRIVCVDYRQGWEHRFPAASEDVASVYRALLADHAPGAIGIFGYSAGGILTAQSLAWFLDKGVPLPGAVAVCSAGGGSLSGDAAYFAPGLMGESAIREPGGGAMGNRFGYLAGTDPNDPLVSPVSSSDTLAAFPPTLVLSGTRSFDLSAAVTLHRGLVRAGATTELHVWDGMWHCFPYNSIMPEADDAFATILRFFDGHLAADRPV